MIFDRIINIPLRSSIISYKHFNRHDSDIDFTIHKWTRFQRCNEAPPESMRRPHFIVLYRFSMHSFAHWYAWMIIDRPTLFVLLRTCFARCISLSREICIWSRQFFHAKEKRASDPQCESCKIGVPSDRTQHCLSIHPVQVKFKMNSIIFTLEL